MLSASIASAGRPRVAVVGAGPAGLMAAERLAQAGAAVTVYDRMPNVARKFLLAGRGGLNLTHSEPLADFLPRYGDAAGAVARFVEAFPPQALRDWCAGLGIETFVGSSGRVFPASFKASPLLRAWLQRLRDTGVVFAPRHQLVGVDADGLLFETTEGRLRVEADAIVLALGGASWPRLGSDAGWVDMLAALGLEIAPLQPANCGFEVAWSEPFVSRFAGTPVKGASFACNGQNVRGEAMVTQAGIEGGAIYALGPKLRAECATRGAAELHLDLKPDVPLETLAARLGKHRPGDSASSRLRKIGLSPVAIGLMREGAGRALPSDPQALAACVKDTLLRVGPPMPIARAISTAGGVRFESLDAHLMARTRPGLFLCGEMLDWEAPTGGYLLQACFASGRAAGEGAARWLGFPAAD